MAIQYDNSDKSFYSDFTHRVNAYFATKRISKYGDIRLHVKTIILLALAPVLYGWIVFFSPSDLILRLFAWSLLGMDFALIGFNIMHDASHGSYSQKKWVNAIMSRSLELMGGSAPFWKKKHAGLHHSFVNTEADEDISFYPLMRSLKAQKPLWIHRYQHVYAPGLYALLYLGWVFVFDFRKYFKGEIHGNKVTLRPGDHAIFWVSKIVYGCLFLVLPSIRLGVGTTIAGYLALALVCGFTISIIFQLAHIVESSTFPVIDLATGKVPVSWAKSQVLETSDFATRSKVLNWLVGGLNFQTVHHLRPDISHVHYPALSPILEEVCRKHGLTYNKISFFGAIRSHFRTLRKLALLPQVV